VLLQPVTLAHLADLLPRPAVHTVPARAAVLSAQTRLAGAALLPPLLLGVLEQRGGHGEEAGLPVFVLDVAAERGQAGGARPLLLTPVRNAGVP